jgi:transposase-like protein
MRKQIDAALMSPEASLRDIAAQFGVSASALNRHRQNDHIAAGVLKQKNTKALREAFNLVDDVDEVVRLTFEIYLEQREKNPRLALDALNSTYKGRDLLAKLTGAFAPERKDITIQEMDISDEELLERAAALDARRKGNTDRADN